MAYSESDKGRCRSCGFLAKQSARPLPDSPNKSYYPVSAQERTSTIELPEIRNYVLGNVPTVLACAKEVESLHEEVQAVGDDIMAVADKDRHCPEWSLYVPGLSPEQHLQKDFSKGSSEKF